MPYITKDARKIFESMLEEFTRINNVKGCTPGELNYLITSLTYVYLEHKGVNYSNLNEIIGVMESAKLEFYRRKVSDYEIQKINENGDL